MQSTLGLSNELSPISPLPNLPSQTTAATLTQLLPQVRFSYFSLHPPWVACPIHRHNPRIQMLHLLQNIFKDEHAISIVCFMMKNKGTYIYVLYILYNDTTMQPVVKNFNFIQFNTDISHQFNPPGATPATSTNSTDKYWSNGCYEFPAAFVKYISIIVITE